MIALIYFDFSKCSECLACSLIDESIFSLSYVEFMHLKCEVYVMYWLYT